MLPAATVATPAAPDPGRDAPPPWTLAQRLGFRFAFAFAAVWLFPGPFGFFPILERITDPYEAAWAPLVRVLGRLLGLSQPLEFIHNGSADTSYGWVRLLALALTALVATAVWSLADRRRRDYERLHAWLRSFLRFTVAGFMFYYGFAKVLHTQFPAPVSGWLERSYGDSSPMGLLWTFMGYSTPYNVFTGLAVLAGGVLLLFRRTTALGALVLLGVMANVVLLNFCYDVPVKIFSTELWLLALFLAGPRLRLLFDLASAGSTRAPTSAEPRATAAPPPPLSSPAIPPARSCTARRYDSPDSSPAGRSAPRPGRRSC